MWNNETAAYLILNKYLDATDSNINKEIIVEAMKEHMNNCSFILTEQIQGITMNYIVERDNLIHALKGIASSHEIPDDVFDDFCTFDAVEDNKYNVYPDDYVNYATSVFLLNKINEIVNDLINLHSFCTCNSIM